MYIFFEMASRLSISSFRGLCRVSRESQLRISSAVLGKRNASEGGIAQAEDQVKGLEKKELEKTLEDDMDPLVKSAYLGELRAMYTAVQNSKIDTAKLCSKFGQLLTEWSQTLRQINAIHDERRKEYERGMETLEKSCEQLLKKNQELKKVFEKLESKFKKQNRGLKLGRIAYKLEILVAEYVFPGDDRASKRARYNPNLKSLKGKIHNLQNEKLKEKAASRLQGLDEEMFEDWFLGIVSELKNLRLDTAHPDPGTYAEMKSVISEEVSDVYKRDDMLKVLEHLQEMYQKMKRPFGE